MDFEVKIKNIGKLNDAKIDIGQFTIFAGPNNTGKSFVSKTLYSIFSGINENGFGVGVSVLLNPVIDSIFKARPLLHCEWNPTENAIHELTLMVTNVAENLQHIHKNNIEEILIELVKFSEQMKDMGKYIEEEIDKLAESRNQRRTVDLSNKTSYSDYEKVRKNVKDAVSSLDNFHRKITNATAKSIATDGLKHAIQGKFIENFQVYSLSELANVKNEHSNISIENIAKIEIKNNNIELSIDDIGIQFLGKYTSMIYLESPIYWKLKNVLENLRINSGYSNSRRERLSGVPGYFYDLASALKYEYTGDMAFPDLHERLTGKDVLGGKIAISESGDLSFQENGRNFSLPVTAMGVANLGILALLIERKVLDKNSFLFIDEPEAHLHPAWQGFMAEALFELAKGGVNVVIATHSADILKWLEVHIKKNPNDESLIALNKFPANGSENGEQDFSDKMAAIKQELTKPFADLYVEGLL